MNLYLIERIGEGTTDSPFRPDVPEGVAWSGWIDPARAVFLVATRVALSGRAPLDEAAIDAECAARGLDRALCGF